MITYSGERNSHSFSLVIGGALVKRQDVRGDTDGRVRVVPMAKVSGRVYCDSDVEGRPLADVAVWLDETRSTQTDSQGAFLFDQVTPGAHAIRADLAGVPADLVFSETPERTFAVLPYKVQVQDFVVVRTGSVVGKVTYLDYSEDPDNPTERPLADARIVADVNHDTFSGTTGNITLGSLPPGTYRLRVDPETVPNGYVQSPDSLNIQVKPGETIRGVRLQLAIPPKPVIIKELPNQVSQYAR